MFSCYMVHMLTDHICEVLSLSVLKNVLSHYAQHTALYTVIILHDNYHLSLPATTLTHMWVHGYVKSNPITGLDRH